MSYDAELQALRELAHYVLPVLNCYFCGERMLTYEDAEASGFGHRRHRAVKVKFTFHHLDKDRTHNSILTNIRIAHRGCHQRHHNKERSQK